MGLILYFLVTALLIWAVQTYGGSTFGIVLSGENTFVSALIFSVIFSLVNLILGTILRVLTFPINWITFGAFSFLITLLVVWVTDSFYSNLTITNWIGYVVLAIIPVLSSGLLNTAKK